jgi:hypothetical protein
VVVVLLLMLRGVRTYRLDGALHVNRVQPSARAKRRHVDVAGQVSAQSTALSSAAGDVAAGAGRHCAVERGEGLRHGCAAEDPGRIRRICVGRSRLLRKLWVDKVCMCVCVCVYMDALQQELYV